MEPSAEPKQLSPRRPRRPSAAGRQAEGEAPAELNQRLFEAKARRHREQAALPIEEKFRILLVLQKQDLPFLERLRPLKPWEKPWDIEP